MKRARIDQAFYDALAEAYRDSPGNHTRAGRATGADRRTCRKGWAEGWPEIGFAPISEVINDEMLATRAKLKETRSQDLATNEREAEKVVERRDLDARDDAILARTEEARTVRAARHNAMGLLATVQRLLSGAHQLAAKMEREIANADLTPTQAISLFQTLASTARASNETAKLAIAMERNLLGEPEKIVGHVHMTEAEAVREIRLASAAAARAVNRGVVVDVAGEPVPELVAVGS